MYQKEFEAQKMTLKFNPDVFDIENDEYQLDGPIHSTSPSAWVDYARQMDSTTNGEYSRNVTFQILLRSILFTILT